MKVAIMQPYFLPYLGYFQLMKHVDIFVIYDDVQYTSKGWINRNNYVLNKEKHLFTLPVRKSTLDTHIKEKEVGNNFEEWKQKFLRSLKLSYSQQSNYKLNIQKITKLLSCKNKSLGFYLSKTLHEINKMLDIDTQLYLSSSIYIDKVENDLSRTERLISICNTLNSENLINPIGGKDLYDRVYFKEFGISLNNIKMNSNALQNEYSIDPSLSILHFILNDGVEKTKEYLDHYEII